jgi:hypothetical protein
MFWLYIAALFPITLLGVVILYDSVTAHFTARRKRALSPHLSGLDDYVIKAPQHYVRLPVTVCAVLGRAAQKRALDKSREELLEKLADLEEFQRSVVGRELKMMEMANEIEYLRSELRQVK